MNPLKKISYNCRQATFLIEKKSITRISIKEQFELKFHLAGCSVCQLFEQQSLMIDRMVKRHFFTDTNENPKLDDDFKSELAKRIETEMNKK
ncbi:hypothetical protein [Pedobacter frigiditerrae]|uniref:hypothetical protein n=1 Tax=Pedobacter frigiditerrae TaxID=2530452 RepID=UPI002930A059|nr:hypothetical protein [Pedobacter frigiditerrae]